jgi:hypothetical protein
MAVNRQINFLGQQRVDVPHIRQLESSICYDFDAVGLLVTGGVPCVVSGFDVVNYTTVIGSLVSNLTLKTANGRLVHPLASDAGSFFQVPSNRSNEVLNTSNPRVQGSWTPGTTNYVGIDLIRRADNETSTLTRFITTNPDTETNKRVPLARTMDYVITIATTPFSVLPSVCPVLIVTTDSKNFITAIKDARNLLFRNGSGGDSPNYNNPFGWPGGRNEANLSTALVAGDKSIKSLKQWMNAIMTRLQELGGGEYWYSLTADRNVRMTQEGVFDSNGESFEWDGTNLHWKGVRFVFDNSTVGINEVADQLTSSSGLTNLADGDCIYVELDRSSPHTVAGGTAIVAKKMPLVALGGSTIPGQRWTIAQRVGTKIFVRDQSYPVGSSFKLATITNVGTIRTTINANGTISEPIAVGLADSAAGKYTATCGGISHNTDRGVSTLIGSGDIVIGRGNGAGDGGVFIQSDTDGKPVVLYGATFYNSTHVPAIKILQAEGTIDDVIAGFGLGNNVLPATATVDPSVIITSINNDKSISMSTATVVPRPVGVADSGNVTYNKLFFRYDKTSYGNIDAIFDLHQNPFAGWTYNSTAKTWTHTSTVNALTSEDFNGVTPTVGMKVLGFWISGWDNAQNYAGFFTVTALGGGGNNAVLTVLDSIPLFEGVTVFNNAATGDWSQSFIKLDSPDPLIYGVTPLRFILTSNATSVTQYAMWSDGSTTAIAKAAPSAI